MNIEQKLAVEDLNARYAEAIDEGRFEEWPDFFTDDGKYRVTTAENVEQNLPLSLIYATSRAMLRDRVKALREANIYEAQRYRHLVSATLIDQVSDGVAMVRSNYLVLRIMQDGVLSVFSAGRYLDRIELSGAEPLFQERIVVFDNKRIDTLLAIPL